MTDHFKTAIRIERLGRLKRKWRPVDFSSEIREQADQRNHVACQTEHLWYIARAIEQIAKHAGIFTHMPPTASGKKK